ncbi:hypothetical protein FRC08_004845 [Ceratobasidium sp. 394]|nr:hypothetical protein FRC08_004845 [Ceratobasidium sp. 394]
MHLPEVSIIISFARNLVYEHQRRYLGSGIEQYARGFGLYPQEILDGETLPLELDDISSLAALEASLISSAFDPWNSDNDPTTISFNRAIQILRNYITRSGLKIFERYYGFLCVRHLLQITCLTVLREMSGQDDFPGSSQHGNSWNELARIATLKALQLAGEATTNSTSLEALYRVFTSRNFELDNSTIEADSSFLVRVLWLNRAYFLKLCAGGLLPGCSLLLLALLKLFPVTPEQK